MMKILILVLDLWEFATKEPSTFQLVIFAILLGKLFTPNLA